MLGSKDLTFSLVKIKIMRRDIVDDLLVSFYIINAIMPICDDSGIIRGACFPVGHSLALPK